ncbi:MAG: glycoside hydrolase family 32 protein, partial [Bacteroidetes bacterium]|nr:glycoside hydrolase family 32 protein [Bacteroidota bacterium]
MKKIPLFIAIIILSGCQPQNPGATEETINWESGELVPKSVIKSTRLFRERLLSDPHRPAYHFAVPEDRGIPGDPNGAFYYDGRYHLMYLYHREGSGFAYGHISSKDLLHWRHHPDAVGPGDGDNGIFSGGGFVDDDGTAVITYWEFMGREVEDQHNAGTYSGRPFGIGIATSTDKHFNKWEKVKENPVIASTHWGITQTENEDGEEVIYGSADPSQIWKKDGKYYMLTGNLLVLRKFGTGWNGPPSEPKADSVKFQGDWLDLFVSDDMKKWEYLHRFYESERKWTDKTEDNMCPSFLPLPSSPDGGAPSDKHLLLFISHNMGCQYYVGAYRDDKFYPDNHGRMTWDDNNYFAPEALMASDGRQIMWAWIHDGTPDSLRNHYGWSGVYGLPRSLWLGNDGTLRMRPVKELANLRQNERIKTDFIVESDSELTLESFGDQYLELEITLDPGQATQAGVLVGVSQDGREKTALFYDAEKKELTVDAMQSTINDFGKTIDSGPFELGDGEALVLRVFIDGGIVEVYANDRQALGRRFYPALGGTNIKLF